MREAEIDLTIAYNMVLNHARHLRETAFTALSDAEDAETAQLET
jgi:hypothetical protein